MIGLLSAYAFLLYRGISIALRARDDYGTYVAFGISMLFGLQVFINLGVAMGMLPTKGLTLPMVSYGGSSLVINLIAVGIMLSISRACVTREEKRTAHTATNKRMGDREVAL
jgi:cell division protein FtsW